VGLLGLPARPADRRLCVSTSARNALHGGEARVSLLALTLALIGVGVGLALVSLLFAAGEADRRARQEAEQ